MDSTRPRLTRRFLMIVPAAIGLSLPSTRGAVPVDPPGAVRRAADDEPKAGDEERERSEFLKLYGLKPGQDLKLVPMPRPKSTLSWMKKESPHMADQLNDVTAMTFRWRDPDRLQNQASHYGSVKGWPLRSIPRYLEMDLHEYEIEGNRELLETGIPGDRVYREGVSPEKKAHTLQGILRKTLDPKIAVEFRLVERNVIVVRGKYRYTPIGKRTNNHIEIYAKEIVKDGGAGGGGGKFPEFLKWVGSWIEMPVVSEVTTPPEETLGWSYNGRNPATASERREDHDEALVLKHLEEQTGLTYTLESRDIRVLVIEKAK
jgi:hypothetical protein